MSFKVVIIPLIALSELIHDQQMIVPFKLQHIQARKDCFN